MVLLLFLLSDVTDNTGTTIDGDDDDDDDDNHDDDDDDDDDREVAIERMRGSLIAIMIPRRR